MKVKNMFNVFKMPTNEAGEKLYLPPTGGPLYWQKEISGVLPAAMNAYVKHSADNREPEPNEEQIEAVRVYFEYYIEAPCWDIAAGPKIFKELKIMIKVAKTVGELDKFVNGCMEVGLDPM